MTTPQRRKQLKNKAFAIFSIVAMGAVFLYLGARIWLFFIAAYAWEDKILALMLLTAELFTMIQTFGYFQNIYLVSTSTGEREPFSLDNVPLLESYPPVAIIVSSFKEPIDVLEDTLICFYNLTYPNKHIYFLDDTRYDLVGWDPEAAVNYRNEIDELCRRIGVNQFRRRWRGAKAGMINDFLAFLDNNPPEGFSFISYGERNLQPGDEKYIFVFDADMNPFPDFAEPLVAFMEQYPRLAFIQTPQYYSNFEFNRVARASGLQQAVFYEYICEGKSLEDAMFCCGTNVIFRRAALNDVGGFDETSVTEDFATSLKFHIQGWSSAYLNKVLAFGIGPEDLGAYFKQQFRWALGTVGLFRTIAREFIRNPSKMRPMKWWEYFLSGTHYFIGWILFVMMICPALYLLTNTPSYFAKPELYFLFFLPYIILTFTLFIFSMRQRKYSFMDLATGAVLQALCFPVYMHASLLALLGVRGTFGITPKGRSLSLPLYLLWPQIGMALFSFTAVVWGVCRLYYEREPFMAIAINTAWCLYHFAILST
ncbi:MAG: glycosyltransferase family 2 protein, partial [Desulfoprunum sp.]|nr:glycosyltransferase family 2 protein [Desulfoprunum sp.]